MARFIQGYTDYEKFRDHNRDNAQYKARMAVIESALKDDAGILEKYAALVEVVKVVKMSGKLEGYYSVSTSVLINKICQARARVEGSICQKCYAASTAERYHELALCLETNHIVLNTWLIPENEWEKLVWPTTNGDARIEAFGDVETVACAQNYLRIIKTHPWINFGVWTKNSKLWYEAMRLEGGKPKNMKFIVSSTHINTPEILEDWEWEYVDHVFTVYTKEYAEARGIVINCGGAKCVTCRNCYKCGVKHINELLK